MDLSNIIDLIRPELFILVIFLFAIGKFLKMNPNFKKDYTIPYILVAVSIVITQLYIGVVLGEGFSFKVLIVSFIQAVLIAAFTVFGNELIKQGTNKKVEDQVVSNDKIVKVILK